MHHDGSSGARARSARIRSSHDDEATRLDSMRRNAAARDAQPARVSLRTRVASVFGRQRTWNPTVDAEGESIASARLTD
jgi:hypothetical protein